MDIWVFKYLQISQIRIVSVQNIGLNISQYLSVQIASFKNNVQNAPKWISGYANIYKLIPRR